MESLFESMIEKYGSPRFLNDTFQYPKIFEPERDFYQNIKLGIKIKYVPFNKSCPSEDIDFYGSYSKNITVMLTINNMDIFTGSNYLTLIEQRSETELIFGYLLGETAYHLPCVGVSLQGTEILVTNYTKNHDNRYAIPYSSEIRSLSPVECFELANGKILNASIHLVDKSFVSEHAISNGNVILHRSVIKDTTFLVTDSILVTENGVVELTIPYESVEYSDGLLTILRIRKSYAMFAIKQGECYVRTVKLTKSLKTYNTLEDLNLQKFFDYK